MELRTRLFYRIPFSSRAVTWSCALMGISIFLRYLYYVLFCDPDSLNVGVWIFRIILPTMLCGSFGILLRLVRLRSPGIYGILAAVICLMLMLWDIMDGRVLEIILSVLTMLVLGFVLLATIGGYIPFRSVFYLLFVGVFCLRLVWGSDSLTLPLWADRISELSMLLSLFFFTVSLKPFVE